MNIVDDIFNRVVFDEDDRTYHFELFKRTKEVASEIDKHVPDSEEKTLAFRSMYLALMHVGTALTKKDKYK